MRGTRSIDEHRVTNGRRWLGASRLRIGVLLFILGAGALIGSQIVHPTKRVIEALAGLLLAYVLWNFSSLNALWAILVIYPFPFAISAGNSTFIFVIIVFIVHLIRVSSRKATLSGDRQFNLPIALMVMSYILSFYNQQAGGELMRFALTSTLNFFAAVLLFYMIVNFVDDEEKLAKTVRVLMVTCSLVVTFTLLELAFPGRELIPGWLYTTHRVALVLKMERMGGPFKDFELNGEFFAMNAPLVLFMIIRSRRLLERSVYSFLLIANLFMLFSTITRGAFVSLGIGAIYMAYTCRKDLSFVRLVILATAFITLLFVLDTVVARYTISGSLFARMLKTTFEQGVIPENRYVAWGGAIQRALEHPFIGHGPGWDFSKGIGRALWPHNAYLYYFNITGIFGLLAFLFLVVRLVSSSMLGFTASIVRAPFPLAFMKALNVSLVIFLVDQIKIDYLRNDIYMYFIWCVFGVIAATRLVILKEQERARHAPSPP